MTHLPYGVSFRPSNRFRNGWLTKERSKESYKLNRTFLNGTTSIRKREYMNLVCFVFFVEVGRGKQK